MSSVYGLAADQVLALEVVLANGRFVTVTEESEPDLFWALRGGGGGAFVPNPCLRYTRLTKLHQVYSVSLPRSSLGSTLRSV